MSYQMREAFSQYNDYKHKLPGKKAVHLLSAATVPCQADTLTSTTKLEYA